MRKFNPYYLLYLIPLILVAGAAYFVFFFWERLNTFYSIFAVLAIVVAVVIMLLNILRAVFSPISALGRADELEFIVLNEIQKRDASITGKETKELLKKARGIAKRSRSKEEKRILLSKMLDEFFKKKSAKNFRN